MAHLKDLLVRGDGRVLGNLYANLIGNATTATTATKADKWTSSRTLTLNGDVTGSTTFDGSGNITIATTVGDDSHSHSNYAKLNTWNDLIHNTNEVTFVSSGYSGYVWFNYRTASGSTDGNITAYKFGNGKGSISGVTVEAATFSGALSGNASTATKFNSDRTITLNGDITGSASGDGSAGWTISTSLPLRLRTY